jgi:hypothetical protein
MSSSIIFYTNEFLDKLEETAATISSNTAGIAAEIANLKTKADDYRMHSAIDRNGSEYFNFQVRSLKTLGAESPHTARSIANVMNIRARALAAKNKNITVFMSRASIDQFAALASLVRALDDYRTLDPIATGGTGSRLNKLTVYHHPSISNVSNVSNTSYATFLSWWADEHKATLPDGFVNTDIIAGIMKRLKNRVTFQPFHFGRRLPKGGLGSRLSIPDEMLDGSTLIIGLKCPLLKYEGDANGWHEWMRYAETDMRFTQIRHTARDVIVDPLDNIENFYSVDMEEKINELCAGGEYPYDTIVAGLKEAVVNGLENTRVSEGDSYLSNTHIGTDGLKKDKYPHRMANTYVQNWEVGGTITYHTGFSMNMDTMLTHSTPANSNFYALCANGSVIRDSNIADFDLTQFIIKT